VQATQEGSGGQSLPPARKVRARRHTGRWHDART
jgi:hypothetical protein